MGTHCIFKIDPAEKKLIGFGILVGKDLPNLVAVVFLGKEP